MKCQFNQWPRDWQNIFAITRFHNIDVLFHIIISLLLRQIQSLILRSIMINQGSTVLKEQSCTYIVFETKILRLRQVVKFLNQPVPTGEAAFKYTSPYTDVLLCISICYYNQFTGTDDEVKLRKKTF